MTTLDLKTIVATGGCVVVNSKEYTTLDLKTIAAAGSTSHGKLYIKHANRLTTLDCKSIAAANPGHVTFDFSE